MELHLDTANISDIRELNDIFVIDGITTNPKIISREKKEFRETIEEIAGLLKKEQMLFAEVLADECEQIVKEAEYINGIRENTFAKIPVSEEGLKAIRICSEKGIKTLATAVFTPTQAYLAAKNGTNYIAPYVNRIEKYSNGVKDTLLMQQIMYDNDFETKIIAAGCKTAEQINGLLEGGVDAITITPELLRELYLHEGTAIAIKDFENVWEEQYDRKTLI